MFALISEFPRTHYHEASRVEAVSPSPEHLEVLKSSIKNQDILLAQKVLRLKEIMDEWERRNEIDTVSPVTTESIDIVHHWTLRMYDEYQVQLNLLFNDDEKFLTRDGTIAPSRTFKIQPVSLI